MSPRARASRALTRLLLVGVLAAPAGAQVTVHGLANAGYDAGYGAPSVGLAAEVAWAPSDAPVAVAVRPSVDVVFAESLPFATTFAMDPVGMDQTDSDVTRLGAEVVAHWLTAPGPATPYLKAGAVYEHERVRSGDLLLTYGQADAVAGMGASVGRAYVEGTLGFGDASRHRLVLGIRF